MVTSLQRPCSTATAQQRSTSQQRAYRGDERAAALLDDVCAGRDRHGLGGEGGRHRGVACSGVWVMLSGSGSVQVPDMSVQPDEA